MSYPILGSYLADLQRALGRRGVPVHDAIHESREHLIDIVASEQRRGLTLEAAQHHSIQRFGTAQTVAAAFATERYRVLNRIGYGLAIVIGIAIAYIDSRPHWDDTGITACALLIGAGFLSAIIPGHPWLLALGVGVWIVLYQTAQQPTIRLLVDAPLILAFPMTGAYAGSLCRRVLTRLNA